ncbi:MAG: hypothetical protein Q7J14_00730 [Candidatus Magasanikbacteria bacterium]|nr:hypothetical protein [Candidatus Magasanikbacteria bacterium]
MRDGKEKDQKPRSLALLELTCALSEKNILSEIQVNLNTAIRLRGKNRKNNCVVLRKELEEIVGTIPNSSLITTSHKDFVNSLVSFVLPVEKLNTAQKSLLQRKFSGENKKVFY